jgi:cytochrome c556
MHRTFTALVIATVALFASTLAARQNVERETATVKHVMQTMTIPASDAIFSAAAETPKDAQTWQAVRKSAMMLAESGTLLMTGGRAKDNSAWIDMARAMVTQAQATLKAIDAKDGDALAQAGDDVYVTCETCHERYMDK